MAIYYEAVLSTHDPTSHKRRMILWVWANHLHKGDADMKRPWVSPTDRWHGGRAVHRPAERHP